jgi:hypothetical protein
LAGRIVPGEDEVGVGGRAFLDEAFEGGAESEEERLEVGFAGGIEATDVEGEEAVERETEGLPGEPFLFGRGRREVVGVNWVRNDFVAKGKRQLARFGFQGFGDAGENVELGLAGGLSGAEGGITGIEIGEEDVEEAHVADVDLADGVLHGRDRNDDGGVTRAGGGERVEVGRGGVEGKGRIGGEVIGELEGGEDLPVRRGVEAAEFGLKGRDGGAVGVEAVGAGAVAGEGFGGGHAGGLGSGDASAAASGASEARRGHQSDRSLSHEDRPPGKEKENGVRP